MKVRYLLYIAFFSFFLASCTTNNNKEYIVEGTISELTHPTLYFITDIENETKIDTILAQNGQFHFSASSDSIQSILIYLSDQSTWITAWAKNGDRIKIFGSAEHPELIEIYGNEINDLLTQFKQENKEASRDSLIFHAKNFIQDHPASITSLVLIQDYLMDIEDVTILGDYLSLIESPAKEDLLYTRLNAAYQRLLQTSVGVTAPDFSLVDIQGDTLTLNSFKGKQLLLTFENSTCQACEEDFPILERIRKNVQKNKLAIVRISFDEEYTTATKNTTSWMQVIDRQGLASPFLTLYNVNQIPDYFLIDKDGRILATHASIQEIEEQLKKRP